MTLVGTLLTSVSICLTLRRPHPSLRVVDFDPMGVRALAVWLLISASSCASAPVVTVSQQGRQIVLSAGKSQRIPETDLTVLFDVVVEDSRCPVGTSCVWAGDATVRIRIDSVNSKPTTYTLHTNERFEREVTHGDVRVRLSSLTPEPTADGPPRSEDYRVTLIIQRKKESVS